jgi:hypothetical protein
MTTEGRIKAWIKANEVAKKAIETERELRAELFNDLFPAPKEGMNKKFVGPYTVSGTYKMNYNLGPAAVVDEALEAIEKIGDDGRFVADRLVRWEPKLMVSEYRILNLKHKAAIDKVLMVTPALPTLKVEEEGK